MMCEICYRFKQGDSNLTRVKNTRQHHSLFLPKMNKHHKKSTIHEEGLQVLDFLTSTKMFCFSKDYF